MVTVDAMVPVVTMSAAVSSAPRAAAALRDHTVTSVLLSPASRKKVCSPVRKIQGCGTFMRRGSPAAGDAQLI
jgi:hypothetical protein